MPARNYYRGGYGDTKPVTVHPSKALDHKGKLLPDHFENEAAAWGSIMAYCEDSVRHAERRGMHLNKAMIAAVDDLVARRAAQRKADSAFRDWKARHPATAAV
jgi:hypothetical protein